MFVDIYTDMRLNLIKADWTHGFGLPNREGCSLYGFAIESPGVSVAATTVYSSICSLEPFGPERTQIYLYKYCLGQRTGTITPLSQHLSRSDSSRCRLHRVSHYPEVA